MKTVFVGMSGGVDSSVTAMLLKQQGYRVIGVYMKNWTQDFPGTPCTWKQDYQDAKRVAVKLGIDLRVYDFETAYRQKVVNYMVSEYQAGRTPNPDIMCNQEVKFKLFLDTALGEGADMIATGHYARTYAGKLLTAKNTDKDQTYFLYRISSQALHRTLFPIGEFGSKAEIRALAKENQLVTADKKDSQGICFVGQVGIKDFLLNELGPQKKGDILDQNGKKVGEHDGAIFYTIGQRHGLQVGGGMPYYVVSKDIKNNLIYVTNNIQDDHLWQSQLILDQVHWITEFPGTSKSYRVRTRHRAPLVTCDLKPAGNKLILSLTEPVRAITPGQSAVIYDSENVLGGGIVTSQQNDPKRQTLVAAKPASAAKRLMHAG